MSSTFDIEMNKLSQEVVSMKSQKPQPASVLETYTTSLDLSFNLTYKIRPILITFVCSDKMAVIDFGVTNDPLASIELNIDSTNGRSFRTDPYLLDNGHLGRLVYIDGGNDSDLETLSHGGTITVNFSINIKSTEEITPTVTYKDLWIV